MRFSSSTRSGCLVQPPDSYSTPRRARSGRPATAEPSGANALPNATFKVLSACSGSGTSKSAKSVIKSPSKSPALRNCTGAEVETTLGGEVLGAGAVEEVEVQAAVRCRHHVEQAIAVEVGNLRHRPGRGQAVADGGVSWDGADVGRAETTKRSGNTKSSTPSPVNVSHGQRARLRKSGVACGIRVRSRGREARCHLRRRRKGDYHRPRATRPGDRRRSCRRLAGRRRCEPVARAESLSTRTERARPCVPSSSVSQTSTTLKCVVSRIANTGSEHGECFVSSKTLPLTRSPTSFSVLPGTARWSTERTGLGVADVEATASRKGDERDERIRPTDCSLVDADHANRGVCTPV